MEKREDKMEEIREKYIPTVLVSLLNGHRC